MLTIFTNGCFDLLHAGHIKSIQKIKEIFPNSKLIIGINSDASITKLKGESRPIIHQDDRRFMLENIKGVDEVTIFTEDTPQSLIEAINPDIVVKGEDYYKRDVVGFNVATEGIFIMKHYAGYSTSEIINKIKLLT